MKAKLYILTYNNEAHLNTGLKSLFSTDLSKHNLEIYIINNHTNFHLNDEFVGRVTVLHNVMQPDFGFGHPPRNWNQALILGFKDLNNPDCDIVICAHDDTHYQPQWLNLLYKTHFELGIQFCSFGSGDMMTSSTPTSVKTVGLWDERYASLCFYEHDYFLRTAMYLGKYTSINDTGHRHSYVVNPLPYANEIAITPPRNEEQNKLVPLRAAYENPFRELFKAKWGNYSEFSPVSDFLNRPRRPNIDSYITYPYFEKDIDNLTEMGFNLSCGWRYPWM